MQFLFQNEKKYLLLNKINLVELIPKPLLLEREGVVYLTLKVPRFLREVRRGELG